MYHALKHCDCSWLFPFQNFFAIILVSNRLSDLTSCIFSTNVFERSDLMSSFTSSLRSLNLLRHIVDFFTAASPYVSKVSLEFLTNLIEHLIWTHCWDNFCNRQKKRASGTNTIVWQPITLFLLMRAAVECITHYGEYGVSAKIILCKKWSFIQPWTPRPKFSWVRLINILVYD